MDGRSEPLESLNPRITRRTIPTRRTLLRSSSLRRAPTVNKYAAVVVVVLAASIVAGLVTLNVGMKLQGYQANGSVQWSPLAIALRGNVAG